MAQILDWLAQSYLSASKPLNAARAVNCFAETELQDARSKAPVAVWGTPGTSPFATVADLSTLAASVLNGLLYVIGQGFLWSVSSAGVVTNLGAHGAQGRVSVDNNGVQLCWVDGVTGWVYQPGGITQQVITAAAAGDTALVCAVTGAITLGDTLNITLSNGIVFTTTAAANVAPGPSVSVSLAAALPAPVSAGASMQDPAVTLAQITDPNFYASNTVTYFDGYFVFVRNGTKEFFLSPLFGIGPFNGAMFASKEATSDLLQAIANSHEQLYLCGTERIEVWYDAGNAAPAFPFQRSDGAIVQRGVAAPYSIIVEDNTLFFLGDDGMYYRLDGFVPERISNHGCETAWSTYPTLSDCFGLTYTLFGHKMIALTFPSAKATWELDLSTRRWHERESWIGTSEDSSIGRWRVNWAIAVYDRILFGDSQSGQIQALNQNVYTEFGDTVRMLLIGAPFHCGRVRCFMRRFEIDVETGVGLTEGPATNASQYCAQGVEAVGPLALATSGALLSTPATFSTCLFSINVYLPDVDAERGMWFSNQTSDTAPGNGGLQIGIFNDLSSTAGHQIIVRAWDAANAAILDARFAFTTWTAYANVLISIDTATQQLQVYLNDGTGDLALVPALITWSSTNPIANQAAKPWHVAPSTGP